MRDHRHALEVSNSALVAYPAQPIQATSEAVLFVTHHQLGRNQFKSRLALEQPIAFDVPSQLGGNLGIFSTVYSLGESMDCNATVAGLLQHDGIDAGEVWGQAAIPKHLRNGEHPFAVPSVRMGAFIERQTSGRSGDGRALLCWGWGGAHALDGGEGAFTDDHITSTISPGAGM